MKVVWALIILSLLVAPNVSSEGRILSLPDEERVLLIPELKDQEIFLCESESRKVFGKNPSLANECYSLKAQSIFVSLSSFLDAERKSEKQFGFYTSDNHQIFPAWETDGKRFILISFVVTVKGQLYVQAIKKETKAYYFWRTKAEQWVLPE